MENMKICFCVQRYGKEVNGGAELYCRQMAGHLKGRYERIDVLTSRAVDYSTWEDFYPEGVEQINGINVRRFSVAHPRDQRKFDKIDGRFMHGLLKASEEESWVDAQGPCVPGLLDYIREHADYYDVFVFVTYLYYPAVMGLPLVADKSILIPHAHDEPFLRLRLMRRLFKSPSAIFFNTEDEMRLVHSRFGNGAIPYDIGGVGVDLPQNIDADAFCKKYGLSDFMLYVGRIDDYGKNCGTLFKYFREYRRRNGSDMKLVLMGRPEMRIPKDEGIVSLGFVSEEDKFNGIKAAKILVMPSKFESLSIAVLEAMSLGTTVLVNGGTPVLKRHCTKSNGGLYYKNYLQFEGAVNYILTHPQECGVMRANAKRYVDENYRWDIIVERLDRLIHCVASAARAGRSGTKQRADSES